jgi:hypothetical protein
MFDATKADDGVWRRSLLAVGAMLCASAAFVLVFMLLLFSLVDRAIAPASGAASRADEHPAAVGQPGAAEPVQPKGNSAVGGKIGGRS